MTELFQRSFPDIEFYSLRENKHEVIIEYDLNLFDKGIYWMSLGKYVRQDIAEFPKKNIPYLKPNNNKVNEIKINSKKVKILFAGFHGKVRLRKEGIKLLSSKIYFRYFLLKVLDLSIYNMKKKSI